MVGVEFSHSAETPHIATIGKKGKGEMLCDALDGRKGPTCGEENPRSLKRWLRYAYGYSVTGQFWYTISCSVTEQFWYFVSYSATWSFWCIVGHSTTRLFRYACRYSVREMVE